RERLRRVTQVAEQRDRQRVHRRTVEAEQRDAAVVTFGEHEFGHGARTYLVVRLRPVALERLRNAAQPSGPPDLRLAANRTSAPTGTKPAASVERTDAALPGATCAQSGSPAGTSPRAAATRRRPRPSLRCSAVTS